MAFTPKKQAFSAKINAVTLGTGDKSIVIGGENVLPFYSFDAEMPNSPKIAVEIRDTALAGETCPGMLAFYEGCTTVVDMAKKAETMEGVSAICLYFESADPNGANKSVEECVAIAKAVAEAESVDVRRADEYTLGTWLQTWYELYAKPHLRFSTAEYYRRGIELHIVPRLGDIPLKKLTGRDLQWLYKDLQEHGRLREAQKGKQPGLSDSTIRGIHTMLHNAENAGGNTGCISEIWCFSNR